MRQALKLHPDSVCAAVTRFEVEVARPGPGVLALRYLVEGAIGDLILPQPAPADRTDELWRRTCFEAFVRVPAGEAYLEFNLAPSTQWAAYRFDGYRRGMSPLDAPAPATAVASTDARLEVSALLRGLPEAALRIGLSAVIEEAGGRVSYWALAHPPGKADFHHPDCFALDLPAPEDA